MPVRPARPRRGPTFLLLLSLGLGLGARAGATARPFEPAPTWTAAERAALAAVEAQLPASLQAAWDELALARSAVATVELDEPHAVVSMPARGRALVAPLEAVQAALGCAGSGPSCEEAASEHWRRRILHALVHHEDAVRGWSASPTWRRLSGWGEGLGRGAVERDALSFAEPAGRASAAEDFATMAEQLLRSARLPRDGATPPECRQRAKARHVGQVLALDRRPSTCATLAEVGLGADQVEAVELLHIEASPKSPASLAGHLAVAIRLGGAAPRLDVYQLAADTGGAQARGPLYATRGLMGGYPSRVVREPYNRTVLRYAAENRAVRRLALRLGPEQELRLLERLDDIRQGWDRPYLFLTRNCTHLVRDLVEWATELPVSLPAIYGPDALLGALGRRGLLEELPRERIDAYGQHERAQAAEALRRAARGAAGAQDEALRAALDDSEARDPATRAAAYRAIAERAQEASALDPDRAAALVRSLIWAEERERLLAVQRPDAPRGPGMAALWEALSVAPLRPGLVAEADAALLARLREDEARRAGREQAAGPTLHTPLRGAQADLGVERAAEGELQWVGWSTSLYEHPLGATRRFAAAEGLGIRLLATELRVAPATGSVGGGLQVIAVERVFGERVVGAPGVQVEALGFERPVDGGGAARWTGVAFGPTLGLLSLDHHRLRLRAGARLQAGLEAPEGLREVSAWERDLRLPLELVAGAGSRREPLRRIDAWGAWTPALLQARPSASGGARASWRLGALWERDLAAVGACEAEAPLTGAVLALGEATGGCSLGLRVERY
jgi:hypothetical protein